jgi:hypothetical protein
LLVVGTTTDVAEIVDAQAEHACDALIAPIAIAIPPPTEARTAILETEQAPPPSPAHSRIFRPPRLPFV